MIRGGRRAAAALALLALAGAPVSAAPSRPDRDAFRARFVGKTAPAFALKDTQGGTVRLQDLRGKVVLINFWFSTCLPCRQEIPDLDQLHRLHAARGLVVLGLNLDAVLFPQEQGRYLRSFLQTTKVGYPILLADAAAYRAYGQPPVQPTSFLIDRRGMVAEVFWGAFPGPAFERAILPRLAETQAQSRPAPPRP